MRALGLNCYRYKCKFVLRILQKFKDPWKNPLLPRLEKSFPTSMVILSELCSERKIISRAIFNDLKKLNNMTLAFRKYDFI